MKTIVVYKSKTGFAKKYAEWIAQDLSADIFEASKITFEQLSAYDTVIYGGGVYASGINGLKMITKNFEKLKDKKIAVFGCGASAFMEETVNEIKNKNFSPEQKRLIGFFYLRGGFDNDKLAPFYKLIMKLFIWMIKRKKELTRDEKGMLATYTNNPVDFADKKNISEIIQFVNS